MKKKAKLVTNRPKKTTKKTATRKPKTKVVTNSKKKKDQTLTNQQQADIIANALTSRSALIEKMMDPRRDVYAECGFPREDPEPEQYDLLYRRNPLAKKVVNIKPDHCWKSSPKIFENEDDTETEFEKAVADLHKNLRNDLPSDGEEIGWFSDEVGSPVWELLKRAWRMARKGRYGVILLGFSDVGDEVSTSDRVEPTEDMELLYATPYSECDAEIVKWDKDEASPRFGKPEIYKIGITDPSNISGSNPPTEYLNVHHSRVIHITETPDSSDIFHAESLKDIYNVLHGSEKVIGAAPEGYWKMVVTKLLIEANPGITESDIDKTTLRNQISNWEMGLQGTMSLFGLQGKAIAPTVNEPTAFMDLLESLCALSADCPVRIFRGSERGEQASTQDKSEWNERCTESRNSIVTPRHIVPFFNRLIWVGVLPKPKSFHVEWENLDKLSEKDSSEIADNVASSLVKYSQGDLSNIIELVDFLTVVLGWDDEIAKAVVERVEGSIKDEGKEDERDEKEKKQGTTEG